MSTGIIRGTLQLKNKVYLTPHYIRVVLTGDDISLFSGVTVGLNNKLFIPNKKDSENPYRRTYTLRALDVEAGEMSIDFVAHGDEGPASAWAIHSVAGDTIEVVMKDKSAPLYPEADWYLLAGDHTALPVISVILETLPAYAEGFAFIQVQGPEDILDIKTPSKVKINWLFGDHVQQPHLLLGAVSNVILPREKTKYIFAAAEADAVRSLRGYFKETGIQREELSAYAYWKAGTSEDGSEAERRKEKSE